MTKQEQRRIAIGAARAQLRRSGFNDSELVYTVLPDDALAALDDISILNGGDDLIAAIWYVEASDNQLTLFRRQWRQWQQKRREMECV